MKVVACLTLMISLTVIANLLLKQGAMSSASERAIFGLYSWTTVLGFIAFACSGLIYAIVLRWLPLNVAQSVASMQFIAVIIASALILSESIPPMRWLGIAMIAAGVLLVSSTVGKAGTGKPQTDISAQPDR